MKKVIEGRNIVDVSGFGNSGKTVILDIFKEFDDFYVSDYNFEFNLLRIQDGLLDLKSSIVDNWSPIRSNASIKRFKNLIKRIGPKASLNNLESLIFSNGMNYDYYFNNRFSQISKEYIDSLIDFKYIGEWPYSSVNQSPFLQLLSRIKNVLGLKKQRKECVYISSTKDFLNITKNYLEILFLEFGDKTCKNVVINNAFEPFNPEASIQLFKNAKSIVVKRDPRDIYSSTLNKIDHIVFNPSYDDNDYHKRLKADFLNIYNINEFILRQKIYYEKVNNELNSNVLRLDFEDIVLDYDNQIEKIYEFLHIDCKIHTCKNKYFKPELSKKNIGLWKDLGDSKEIEQIKNALPEYCYDI